METRCDGRTQCRDGSDEKDCRILEYSVGYDKLLPPVDDVAGKVEVGMSLDISNILAIHEVEESITIQFIAWMTFLDHRLTFRDLEPSFNRLSEEEENSVWIPFVYFKNIAKNSDYITFPFRTMHTVVRNPTKPPVKSDITYSNNVNLYNGSQHYMMEKEEITNIWICKYDMAMYPFDTQLCTMEFYTMEYSYIDLVPGNLSYEGPADLSQYFVYNYTMCSDKRGGQSGVKVIIILGRPLVGNILTVFIPTLIMILLGHLSKVYEENYIDMVVQVNLTCLLVLATL